MVIIDSGQINPGEPLGLATDDGTGDLFPFYPEDAELDFSNVGDHLFFFFFFI